VNEAGGWVRSGPGVEVSAFGIRVGVIVGVRGKAGEVETGVMVAGGRVDVEVA